MLARTGVQIICVFCLCIAASAFAGTGLLSTQALDQHLKDPNLILVDMSDTSQYQRFHLSGALSLPYEELVMQQNNISVPIPQEKLITLLGALGISQQANVVVYDDVGGLNAARLYWELEQLGHPQMAILDGGLVKWILEGRAVTNQPASPRPAISYTAQKTGRPLVASLQEVAPGSRKKQVMLLDVRSEDEYRGDRREPRSGHIPGAKWWEWDQAVDVTQGFVQRDAAELRASLATLGLMDKQQPIITYCHSSHRASQAYYTLKRLGFTDVKIYTGSILEYEQHKELPLQKGITP